MRTWIFQLEICWNVLKIFNWFIESLLKTRNLHLANISVKFTEPLLYFCWCFTYMMENGTDIKRSLLKYTYCTFAGLLRWSGECLRHVTWVLWGSRGRAVESHYGRAQQQRCNCTRPLFIILMKCNDSRNKLKIAYPVQII